MGSLRHPIGPLPSSIYWRRRAVALALLAVLALLVVWALGLGGGDSHDEGKGGDGKGPASDITPGPTDTGPTVGERPGGRDESEDEDGSDGSSGGSGGEDDGESAGSGGSDGSGGGSGWKPGSNGSGGTDGGDSAGGGAGGAGGAAVPEGSELPGCKSSDVTASLRSVHEKYAAGDKPRFELRVKNKRGTACKLDLGRDATVVTIKDADGEKVWASDDCTRGAEPALFQLPGSGTAVHTFTWYRKASAADCGTPPAGAAEPGRYEIEVDLEGVKQLDASFELEK